MARTTYSPDPRDSRAAGGESPQDVAPSSGPANPISIDHLAVLLSSGQEGDSHELARDLQLNEIAEQACLATGATGAAIALTRGDELICRASTGPTAPGLGVQLNIEYGLSALCVQTRQGQHCDDTDLDPRVNSEACRQLGVRSVLVVPMLYGDFLLGIFEIFSPQARAFGERDEQTLTALADRVLGALGVSSSRSAEVSVPAEPPKPVVPPMAPEILSPVTPAVTTATPVPLAPKTVAAPKPEPQIPKPQAVTPERVAMPPSMPASYPEFKMIQRAPRDYLTGVLTILVVAVALLLGWVLGHGPTGDAARQLARDEIKAALSKTASPPPPAVTHAPTPVVTPKLAPAEPQPDPVKGSDRSAATVEDDPSKPGPSDASTAPAPGGLVVYRDGKMIFRQLPQKQASPPVKTPMMLAPEMAITLLTHRVEPNYPERARDLHIQGPVILQTTVNEDGTVQELKVVSGDSQLASAAIDAVRLWRFKPYPPQGRHSQFETRITVNFALPDVVPVHN